MTTTSRRDLILARAAATTIDIGVAAAAYVAVAILSAFAGAINDRFSNFLGWVAVVAAVAAFLLNTGYLQTANGQSIGKRTTGLQVLSEDGTRATAGQIWGRAGIDLICLLTIGVLFLVDRIVALTRPDLRRPTDFAIRTMVLAVAS
jgi:uncharacterized RDD family membrane protein YckC